MRCDCRTFPVHTAHNNETRVRTLTEAGSAKLITHLAHPVAAYVGGHVELLLILWKPLCLHVLESTRVAQAAWYAEKGTRTF